MPPWRKLVLTWDELHAIPSSWKAKLSEWRGIDYIHDTADGKGYVGAAYGQSNIDGRWKSHRASGQGDSKLLRARNPSGLQFSILQRTSPDMGTGDIQDLEASWKVRLHTHESEGGLNAN